MKGQTLRLEHAIGQGRRARPRRPLWESRTVTARRLQGRLERVFDWATSNDYRTGDNPARGKGGLQDKEGLSKKPEVEHHRALPYQMIPEFVASLRTRKGTSAKALLFLTLTAARINEVIAMQRGEVDWAKRVWICPAARMKGRKGKRKDHRVPLSDPAVELLHELYTHCADEFVFPGFGQSPHLSPAAIDALLERMCVDHLTTTHGLRSSFRDWAGDETEFPREVAEAALAHAVGDKAEQAYRKGDALERRRRLM